MTKTPGGLEPTKPITKAVREARKAFRQVDADEAMTEHEIEKRAFHANRERLKDERLAREKGRNRTASVLLFSCMPGNYRTSGALAPRRATVGLVGPRFELRDRDRRSFKDKAAVLLGSVTSKSAYIDCAAR